MRVFVYEYTCAAGDAVGAGLLQAEGRAMLSAVVADLARTSGVEVVTLLQGDWHAPVGVQARRVSRPQQEEIAFRSLAATADYALVIAPEFDDLLFSRCRWVDEVGGRLLGPRLDAIRLAADKLALADHWRASAVPTPACAVLLPGTPPPPMHYPLVYKPRFGAGSLATFLVRDVEEVGRGARSEGPGGGSLLQEFVPGQPASVALLIGPTTTVALAPAGQRMSSDGRFRYLGGTVPLPAPLAERAVGLARRAVGCVAGLGGYVGVDLVLGEAADGRDDRALEINPRLTTSYVGLRALAETNLAEALLAVVRGSEIPRIAWKPGRITFRADGVSATR